MANEQVDERVKVGQEIRCLLELESHGQNPPIGDVLFGRLRFQLLRDEPWR